MQSQQQPIGGIAELGQRYVHRPRRREPQDDALIHIMAAKFKGDLNRDIPKRKTQGQRHRIQWAG